MPTTDQRKPGNTTGIVCTVLGGMAALWVVARLSSAAGWQQTWAPPLGAYEWTTLGGGVVAAGLLIAGLLAWTRAGLGERQASIEQSHRRSHSSTE